MGWFEENPVALVVLIIVTVEVWSLVKSRVRSLVSRRQTTKTHNDSQ